MLLTEVQRRTRQEDLEKKRKQKNRTTRNTTEMADKLKSKVEEFMDGEENSMGWVLKELKGNTFVIGDDDDILFNIVVVDAGKFVSALS